MRIILMGPPGVGKGTQAVKLESQFNIPHVSTGDIFRALFRTEDAVGLEVKKYLDQGLLVPDELTNKVVETRFNKDDVHHGFLFDGYPRNVAQAEAFDTFLEKNNWKVDAIVNIDADDELIIERLSGRRVCPNCGKTYHIQTNKPKVEGVCDECGTNLVLRKDDEPETIKKRLDIYHSQTKPLIDYYNKQGLVITVNGSGNIEDIFNEINLKLGELK